MLKSLVLVTLCGCLVINCLQAKAYSGGPGAPGSVVSRSSMVSCGSMVSPVSLVVSSSQMATLVLPGRRMTKFVSTYLKENDVELAEIRDRSSQPFTIIDSVMDHYDLPVELRYLAVIESELRLTAVSRVGAKGAWQLMAGTARELGLKVGRRSDERTNLYKSTGAAALYLRDLHREFKDWLLVLAAYNAGPGPVYRAMRLAGSRNFWVMERYLPKETRQHVRRFIATAYYFTVSGRVGDPVAVAGAAGGGASGGRVGAAGTPAGASGTQAGVVAGTGTPPGGSGMVWLAGQDSGLLRKGLADGGVFGGVTVM